MVSNYLDDILFLALLEWLYNFLIRKFLELCQEVGIPIAMDKTEWATTLIVFLGILLDRDTMTLAVPVEKQKQAVSMIKYLLNKKKATIHELQSLCRFLNFLNKAIFLGRAFTRCMYAKYGICGKNRLKTCLPKKEIKEAPPCLTRQ